MKDCESVRWMIGLLLIAATGSPPQNMSADEGKQIYLQQCARCHGSDGSGTDEFPGSLVGELSADQLADLIWETMPDDDPQSLTTADARAVARYIYDEFYSPLAQMRHQPPRIALSRLTVNQHRQVLADLVGSFREMPAWSDARGLTGHYLDGRNVWNNKNKKSERVDARVDFDFGSAVPVREIEDPRQFSIRWTGAVIAPETGEYEFTLRTEHAAKLFVNHQQSPLVDAWVRSEGENEHSARLFLIGGRAYPLRVEFSKAKQGVDDSAKQKQRPPSPPASISLLWRRPGSPSEVIPQRFLMPRPVSPSYVCSVAFPPDDRSYGWERGTAVSAEWNRAKTLAALDASQFIRDHLDSLAGVPRGGEDRKRRLAEFCRHFAQRAFRSQLSDDELDFFVRAPFDRDGSADEAVQRSVLLVLNSPRFAFREIIGSEDERIASRLSFGLWDSTPDEALRDAAASGELGEPWQIDRQVQRMLNDPRATQKLRRFLLNWCGLDRDHDSMKDPQRYAGFDANAMADLRSSLELFIEEILYSDHSDYRQLLNANYLFVNERLARLFNAVTVVSAADGFVKLTLNDGSRAGILTHPYVMSTLADHRESSPIHRGVFLARDVLGQRLRPPPEAFSPLSPDLHPALTTRQRVELQTSDTGCMNCHRTINSLGFTLENFDAVGRYREMERGKSIDAATIIELDSVTQKISGPRELADWILEQPVAHEAFCEQLFQFLVGQTVNAYPDGTLDHLVLFFAANNFSIRRLAGEIMVVSASHGRDTDSH